MAIREPAMSVAQLEAAYRQYGAMVHRRCRRVLGDDATADDVVQEVFLRVWRYSHGFLAADSPLAWLYRVANRCCYDQLAARRRSPPPEDSSRNEHLAVEALESRDVALRFLGRFNQRIQRLLVLHYVDEMSQEEVAVAVGWSRPTVAKKLAWVRNRAEHWLSLQEKRRG